MPRSPTPAQPSIQIAFSCALLFGDLENHDTQASLQYNDTSRLAHPTQAAIIPPPLASARNALPCLRTMAVQKMRISRSRVDMPIGRLADTNVRPTRAPRLS